VVDRHLVCPGNSAMAFPIKPHGRSSHTARAARIGGPDFRQEEQKKKKKTPPPPPPPTAGHCRSQDGHVADAAAALSVIHIRTFTVVLSGDGWCVPLGAGR